MRIWLNQRRENKPLLLPHSPHAPNSAKQASYQPAEPQTPSSPPLCSQSLQRSVPIWPVHRSGWCGLGHTETHTGKTYQSDWVILKHTQVRLINQIGSYWNTHREDLLINQVILLKHTMKTNKSNCSHWNTQTQKTSQSTWSSQNTQRCINQPDYTKTCKHRRLFNQMGQTKTQTYKHKRLLNHPIILKQRIWNTEDFKPHWNTQQQKIKWLDCAVTCKHKKRHEVWPQRKTKMQK